MKLKQQSKRIVTDTAGYLLVIASGLTGWLPGPGGIPLLIAGLGLLSIHNKWAHDLREYVLKNGDRILKGFFPKNSIAQWAYDLVAVTLYIVSAFLIWRNAAFWQTSLAVSAFFTATFIALMNRERLEKIKKTKRKTS